MKSGAILILILFLGTSCATNKQPIKKPNSLLTLLLPFSSTRTKQVFNHSAIKSYRLSSDCGLTCPDVDIWQYQFEDPVSHKIITSSKPIATKKIYWKTPKEARIIAISLFGSELYVSFLKNYLESFKSIKKLNGITDKKWGFETFTPRIYVPKRNPADLARLGEIKNRIPDHVIKELLDLGCEIAYVDNKLPEAKRDASFWRLAVAQEPMPKGQRIRYLVRDADSILTAAEMYSVADWILSGKKYHRMHITPVCMGPMTAGLWGGTHTGRGDFADYHDLVKNYPYRFDYGDDELFTRDLMWPRLKSSGSVLTHHFPRGGFLNTLGTPYKNSCEEPTQEYCLKMNLKSRCEDRILPETKSMGGAIEALGLRMSLEQLVKEHPEFFNLELENPQRKFIYEAFKS